MINTNVISYSTFCEKRKEKLETNIAETLNNLADKLVKSNQELTKEILWMELLDNGYEQDLMDLNITYEE